MDPAALEAVKRTCAVDDAETMDEVWTSFYKFLRTSGTAGAERAKEVVLSRFSSDFYDLSELGRVSLNRRFNMPVNAAAMKERVLTLNDVVLIAKEIIRMNNTPGSADDDIDHLGYRRIRAVGELVLEHARTGFMRMREKHPRPDAHHRSEDA